MFTDPRSYKSISPQESLKHRSMFLPQQESLGAHRPLSCPVHMISREQHVRLRAVAVPSRGSVGLVQLIQK